MEIGNCQKLDLIEKIYEHVEEDKLAEDNDTEIGEDNTTDSVDLESRSDTRITAEATPTNNCKKRPRKGKQPVNENRADIAFTAMQSVMNQRELRHTRDEYSTFGEAVRHKIRKLSTEYEHEITQFKINEILLHASLGYFRQTTGVSQISRFPSTLDSWTTFAS
ncbi:unnamed protein product [Acanthoscelides obtectus]|uniref:Uncharacterized protein n=1 Tax=Acanthoscelides obtectus TaxID=200917 RepID=A0A9P0NYD5_ACAOB|nr:unnamed protein product [Acanthoscelides obtectus]CAK1654022.1 hypothetical protein AOBTE_LOCUS18429 [Acanthoscelides obtectus]